MSHAITPTSWNPEICGDCGFPIVQHATLYGAPESAVSDPAENTP